MNASISAANCDIRINLLSVSREQAEILVDDEGSVCVSLCVYIYRHAFIVFALSKL